MYIDYFEVNTPLIIWLTLIPATISKLSHINLITCLHIFNILFAAFSFALCYNIALTSNSQKLDSDLKRWILVLVLAFLCFTLPSFGNKSEFGEKEHIFALSCLPLALIYLLQMRLRWNSPYIIIAILGSLIKPVLSIIVFAMLLHNIILKRTERKAIYLQIYLTALFYLIILIIHPSYYFEVVPLILSSYTKLSVGPTNPISKMQWSLGVIMYSCFAPTLAFLTLAPTLDRKALTQLILLPIISLFVVIIQGKLFLYHFIPFNYFFTLFICIQLFRFPTNVKWKDFMIITSIFVISAEFLLQTANYLPDNFHNNHNQYSIIRKPYMDKLEELVNIYNVKSVIILTNDMANSFPPVLLNNLKYTLKEHSMQLLNGQFVLPKQNPKVLEWINKNFIKGLEAEPDMIVVEQPYQLFLNDIIGHRFFLSGNTFEQYFLEQEWAREYMANYQLIGSMDFPNGIFSVYIKKRPRYE